MHIAHLTSAKLSPVCARFWHVLSTSASFGELDNAEAWWERVASTLQRQERDPLRPYVPHFEPEQVTFTSEQLRLAQSYTRTCDVMERCGRRWRERKLPLVPLKFPLRAMTPTTLDVLAESMVRSIQNFIRQLWLAVCTNCLTDVERVPSDVVDTIAALGRRAANEWWCQTLAMLNGEIDEPSARWKLACLFDEFAQEAVQRECARLAELLAHCDEVRRALYDFGTRPLPRLPGGGKNNTATQRALKTARGWWRTVCRSQNDATRQAFTALRDDVRVQRIFGPHLFDVAPLWAMMDTNLASLTIDADDEMHLALYRCLNPLYTDLAAKITIEMHRIDALIAQKTRHDHALWSGIAVATNTTDEHQPRFAITPPAHLGVFHNDGAPVHLTSVESGSDVASPLPAVRLCRTIATLLAEGILRLSDLGERFAQRILALEYAKYESAVLRIMRDTLHPFAYEIAIPFGPANATPNASQSS